MNTPPQRRNLELGLWLPDEWRSGSPKPIAPGFVPFLSPLNRWTLNTPKVEVRTSMGLSIGPSCSQR
jgi:hypothetical protein